MISYIIISQKNADLVKGNYGIYSRIEPIELPDKLFMIPERCLSDPDLKELTGKFEKIEIVKEDIKMLSEVTAVEKDKYYVDDVTKVSDEEYIGVVKSINPVIIDSKTDSIKSKDFVTLKDESTKFQK